MHWLKKISLLCSIIFIFSFFLFKYTDFCNSQNYCDLLRFNITYFVLFIPIYLFYFSFKKFNLLRFWGFSALVYLILSSLLINNIDLSSSFISITKFGFSLFLSICFVIFYSLISLGIIIYHSFKKK